MKIDGTLRGTSVTGVNPQNPARAKNPVADGAKQDNVSLSDTAAQMQALETGIGQSSDMDTSKVDAIKQAISNGTFQVNPERIADGMLTYTRDLLSQKG